VGEPDQPDLNRQALVAKDPDRAQEDGPDLDVGGVIGDRSRADQEGD
jgi:hypothetical protein